MTKWLRRIRGAVGMGLTWAAGWVLVGLLIGVSSKLLPGLPWDRFFDVFDAPLPALAIPGFVGGVIFSAVLGTAARRRRFDELSLPRVCAWGALGGFLLSLVPAAMVAVGLASVAGAPRGVWQLTALISPPLTLLSALSATGSLLLARRAQGRATLEAGEDVVELGPADFEPQLLGESSVSGQLASRVSESPPAPGPSTTSNGTQRARDPSR